MSQKFYSEVTLETLNNATTDTDRFLVGDSGTIKYRTGSQLLSDLGVSGLYVPYTGATGNVDLGTHTLSSYNLIVNHTSGSGVAASITKGGSGEALTINKTSGSGNAMSVTGGLTSLVNLTLSSIANATIDTDRFIVSDGGAIKYRTGAEVLSDIGGQAALTNPITGTGTTNYVSKFTGATTLGDSQIFDNGTNVGIGTTTPFGKLEIRGIESNTKDLLLNLSKYAYGATQFYQNYSNTFYTAGKSLEIEVEALPLLQLAVNNAGSAGKVIFPNGNVGIGTNSPAYKLQVVNSGNTLLQLNGNNTAGTIDTGFTISADDSKNIYLYQRENASTVFGTNNAERMRITSSGNVGIGTTSPNEALSIAGNIELTNGANRYIRIGSATSYYYNLQSVGDDFQILEAGTTPRLTIKYPSGNVGIGTTSPDYPLEIENTNQTSIVYQRTGVSAKKWGFISDNGATYWSNITDNILSITLTNGGNVGIGTTSPGAKLDISQSLSGEGLRVDGAGGGFALVVEGGSSYSTRIRLASIGNNYGGNTPPNNGLIVEGNVGIGTTSPAQKLDVNGIIRASSDFEQTGNSVFKNTSYDMYLQTDAAGAGIIFRTAGSSEKMRITSSGNVGIGLTSPNPSALLHLKSTTQGFLPPVMRTGERNGISSPAIGLMIFNEEDDAVQVYTGEGWRTLAWL